jgi:hypothetical protein
MGEIIAMQSTYAVPTKVSPLIVSTSLAAVCLLFSLLGLAISLIVISHIPAGDFGWVIAHLE